jgi:heterodisulfide reductase subunit B
LNRSCREVTRLVLESEDRELVLAERMALEVHWRICDGCVKFRDQAKLMREAMKRWRGYRDDGSDSGPGSP